MALTLRDHASILPPAQRVTQLREAIATQREAFSVWTEKAKPGWYQEQLMWIAKAETEIQQFEKADTKVRQPANL